MLHHALAVFLAARLVSGEGSCSCVFDSWIGTMCDNVVTDGFCPFSTSPPAIQHFYNVEYFYWRQYGLNEFHLIESTQSVFTQQKKTYPCAYFNGGSTIDGFYFQKMGGHQVWVNMKVPWPRVTYCGDTYWYSYCYEPQQFTNVAQWKYHQAVPANTASVEYAVQTGTSYVNSETYTDSWTLGVTAGLKAGIESQQDDFLFTGDLHADVSFSETVSRSMTSQIGGSTTETFKATLLFPDKTASHILWQFCVTTQRNLCQKTRTTTCSKDVQDTTAEVANQVPRCLPGYCVGDYCQNCSGGMEFVLPEHLPHKQAEVIVSNFKKGLSSLITNTSSDCWLDSYDPSDWARDCIKHPTDPGCSHGSQGDGPTQVDVVI